MKPNAIDKVSQELEKYVGGKVILSGGGGVSNEFYVGVLDDINKDNNKVSIILNEYSPTSDRIFSPHLGSWKIKPVNKNSFEEEVPIGKYTMVNSPFDDSKKLLLDSRTMGMFSSIYDGEPIVLLNNEDEWEKADKNLKDRYEKYGI